MEPNMQMSNPLSWTRRLSFLKRTLRNTGMAGSSSTGSPPLPSPHPPTTPPPLVYQRLNVLQVVSLSVDSRLSLLRWFSPPWSPPCPTYHLLAQVVEWLILDRSQHLSEEHKWILLSLFCNEYRRHYIKHFLITQTFITCQTKYPI